MAKDNALNVLMIRYDKAISPIQIPYFRGAVIATIGRDTDILFHNHKDDEKYRYSYPLVQYKRMGGKACVVLINDAIAEAGALLGNMNVNFQIGNTLVNMSIEKVATETCEIRVTDEWIHYRIQEWLPLNEENYRCYMQMDGLIERVELLQNILVGNIISMCKGLSIMMTDEINVVITSLSTPHSVEHKGVKLLSFDVDFKSNVSLPNHIGLGKNASLGCGMITNKYN